MDKRKIYSEKEIAVEFSVSPWTVRLWRLQSGLPRIFEPLAVFFIGSSLYFGGWTLKNGKM